MFPVFIFLAFVENLIRFFSGKSILRLNDSIASISSGLVQDCFRFVCLFVFSIISNSLQCNGQIVWSICHHFELNLSTKVEWTEKKIYHFIYFYHYYYYRIHIRSLEVFCYCLVFEHFRLTTLPWNSLATWLYCFLLVDFGFYWAHRLAHEINFIWAIHQAHHSGEDFTLVAALRQAVLQPFTAWVSRKKNFVVKLI